MREGGFGGRAGMACGVMKRIEDGVRRGESNARFVVGKDAAGRGG